MHIGMLHLPVNYTRVGTLLCFHDGILNYLTENLTHTNCLGRTSK